MPLDRFAPAHRLREPKPVRPGRILAEWCNQRSSLAIRIRAFDFVACMLPDCAFPPHERWQEWSNCRQSRLRVRWLGDRTSDALEPRSPQATLSGFPKRGLLNTNT